MYSTEQFVLHKHEAKTAGDHYDFRISIPNRSMLASFAIPKMNIPTKPGDKSLLIRTSDHGRMWLFFKGEIPEGQYGAGTISIIQSGSVDIEGWSTKHITFVINDEKSKYFNGRYALIKFKGSKSSDKNNLWILVKTKKQ